MTNSFLDSYRTKNLLRKLVLRLPRRLEDVGYVIGYPISRRAERSGTAVQYIMDLRPEVDFALAIKPIVIRQLTF